MFGDKYTKEQTDFMKVWRVENALKIKKNRRAAFEELARHPLFAGTTWGALVSKCQRMVKIWWPDGKIPSSLGPGGGGGGGGAADDGQNANAENEQDAPDATVDFKQHIIDFISAQTPADVLVAFSLWMNACEDLEASEHPDDAAPPPPSTPHESYRLLQKHTRKHASPLNGIWDLLDGRFAAQEYQPIDADAGVESAIPRKVLVLGAGAAGLLFAAEATCLGCQSVVVVFDEDPLPQLAAVDIRDLDDILYTFGGKFLALSFQEGDETVQALSMREIELLLLKIALIMGVNVDCQPIGGISPPYEDKSMWTPTASITKEPLFSLECNILTFSKRTASDLLSSLHFSFAEYKSDDVVGIAAHYETRCSDVEITGFISRQSERLFKKKGVEWEGVRYYRTESSHYLLVEVKLDTLRDAGVFDGGAGVEVDAVTGEKVDYEALETYTRQIATVIGIPATNDLLNIPISDDILLPALGFINIATRTIGMPSALLGRSDPDGEGEKKLLATITGEALGATNWAAKTAWRRLVEGVDSLTSGLRDMGVVERWDERVREVFGGIGRVGGEEGAVRKLFLRERRRDDQVAEALKKARDAQSERDQMADEKVLLEADRDDLRKRCTEAEGQHGLLAEQIRIWEDDYNAVEADLRKSRQKVEREEESVGILSAQIEELKKDVNEARLDADEFETNWNKAEEEKGKLEKEKAAVVRRVGELEQEKREAERAKDAAEGRSVDLEKQNRQLLDRLAALETKQKECQEDVRALLIKWEGQSQADGGGGKE
ncbi:[F-actin]-monooxygenase mical3 [Rhizophlyctis rosea]|nr:[F-actin]-monooxygenase mical3 [Rhizophlyctis rosea]